MGVLSVHARPPIATANNATARMNISTYRMAASSAATIRRAGTSD